MSATEATAAPSLRQARPAEHGALSELAMRSKAYWGYSQAFMEDCRAELTIAAADFADPGRQHVVAEMGASLLGYYALERLTADVCELDALFVEPEHIGRGVGRALLAHATRAAATRGARTMLVVADPNAATFYAAAGATRIGARASGSIGGRYLPEYRIDLTLT